MEIISGVLMNSIITINMSFYPQMGFLLYMIYGKTNNIQVRKLHVVGVLCEEKICILVLDKWKPDP